MAIESKFSEHFRRLREAKAGPLLYGDRLIVEVLPKDEIKSAGGLIIAEVDTHRTDTVENKPTLCLILHVGAGYEDEEGNSVPLPYVPGEIILVSNYSLKYYSQFPGLADATKNQIALTRTSEIHMSWPSLEFYENQYKPAINGL